jgi:very-short-patch-repair endonuclease
MPRYVKYNSSPTAKKNRVQGYKRWVDPFPTVRGTLPEKIVYAALVARGIRFNYVNKIQFNNPDVDFFQEYTPDFLLPDQKIIIEVQGLYWHTKTATQEADAFKLAVYEMFGYKALAWWDYEIEQDVNVLFLRDLPGYSVRQRESTEFLATSKFNRDDSAGVKTLNRKRGLRLAYRKKPIGIKTKKKRYTKYSIGVK